MVDNLSPNELLSIVLHEAGHLKLNHFYKLYLANLIVSAFSYFLFQFRSAYFSGNSVFTDSLSVFLTGCFVGLLIYYIPGKFQYVFELQADSFSAVHNGKDNLKMSLTKLDELSNGDVSKGGVTHPTLDKRLLNIQFI